MRVRKRKQGDFLLWSAQAVIAVLRAFFCVKETFAPPEKKQKLRALREKMNAIERDKNDLLQKIENAKPGEVMTLVDAFEDRYTDEWQLTSEQQAAREAHRAKLRDIREESDALQAIVRTHGWNTEATINELRAYISAHPESRSAYSYLGMAFQKRKQWNESLAAFGTAEQLAEKEAKKVDEDEAHPVFVAIERLHIGDVLQEKGDLEAAIAQYRHIINTASRNEELSTVCLVYLRMGEAYQKLNRHGEARAAWKNAIKHDEFGPIAKLAREKLHEKA